MRCFTTITELQTYLKLLRSGNRSPASVNLAQSSFTRNHSAQSVSIGLVPTMGALHQGHMSLIERARQENDCVVVSIFVNPLQFTPQEDLAHYPRNLEHDKVVCKNTAVDALFVPTIDELYGLKNEQAGPFTHLTQVMPPASMLNVLCGRSRPLHFQGVATVVAKLFNIVHPTRAYFGQKDAQQVAIVRKLVADLNLPGQIVVCPIVRESSGLALSSRNFYLTPAQRQQATVLYRSLQKAQQLFHAQERNVQPLLDVIQQEIVNSIGVKLDYAEGVHPDTLVPLVQIEDRGLLAIAAHVGSARLIDNITLSI